MLLESIYTLKSDVKFDKEPCPKLVAPDVILITSKPVFSKALLPTEPEICNVPIKPSQELNA